MHQVVNITAAALMAGVIAATPMSQAKADGGTTAVIIGSYLVADYVVGRHCAYREWPFNIVTKITRTKPCRYKRRKRRPRKRY